MLAYVGPLEVEGREGVGSKQNNANTLFSCGTLYVYFVFPLNPALLMVSAETASWHATLVM